MVMVMMMVVMVMVMMVSFQYLAMTTPGGIKLNKDEFICVQSLLEVLLCEHKNSFLFGDFTKGCPKEEKTHQQPHLGSATVFQ